MRPAKRSFDIFGAKGLQPDRLPELTVTLNRFIEHIPGCNLSAKPASNGENMLSQNLRQGFRVGAVRDVCTPQVDRPCNLAKSIGVSLGWPRETPSIHALRLTVTPKRE